MSNGKEVIGRQLRLGVETATICWQRAAMVQNSSAVPHLAPPPLAVVVLAAGKGTRMKSEVHKVLHPIAGRPMIEHLMDSVAALSPERQVVVAGHGREQLAKALGESTAIAVQEPQLGTGHAVQRAQGPLTG